MSAFDIRLIPKEESCLDYNVLDLQKLGYKEEVWKYETTGKNESSEVTMFHAKLDRTQGRGKRGWREVIMR